MCIISVQVSLLFHDHHFALATACLNTQAEQHKPMANRRKLTRPSQTGSDARRIIQRQEEELMLHHLVDPLSSVEAQLAAARYFRKLLSGHRDNETRIGQLLRHEPLVPGLVKGLQKRNSELQLDCAWAITNLACGTRHQTHILVDQNVVPALISAASTGTSDELRNQCVWALSNIAGDCWPCKQSVVEHGFIELIVELSCDLGRQLNIIPPNSDASSGQPSQLPGASTVGSLQTCIWALSNVCRGRDQLFTLMQLLPVVPLLRELVVRRAELHGELVADALWTVAFVANIDVGSAVGTEPDRQCQCLQIDTVLDSGLLAPLVDSLGSDHPRIRAGALRTLGNLVTGNDAQTQRVLDHNLLPDLHSLIGNESADVRREVLWTLSNIAAGTTEQIQVLIDDAPLVNCVCRLLYSEEPRVRREAAWTLSNACSGASVKQRNQLQFDYNIAAQLNIILEGADLVSDRRLHLMTLAALEALIEALPAHFRSSLMLGVGMRPVLRALTQLDQADELHLKALAIAAKLGWHLHAPPPSTKRTTYTVTYIRDPVPLSDDEDDPDEIE